MHVIPSVGTVHGFFYAPTDIPLIIFIPEMRIQGHLRHLFTLTILKSEYFPVINFTIFWRLRPKYNLSTFAMLLGKSASDALCAHITNFRY